MTNTETGDAGEAETEPGDDGEAYEVGIRRADGSQIEAELDSNFNVTVEVATVPLKEFGVIRRADCVLQFALIGTMDHRGAGRQYERLLLVS